MDEAQTELQNIAETKGKGQPIRLFQIGREYYSKALTPKKWVRPDQTAHPPIIRSVGARKRKGGAVQRRYMQKKNRNQAKIVSMQNKDTYRKRRNMSLPLI